MKSMGSSWENLTIQLVLKGLICLYAWIIVSSWLSSIFFKNNACLLSQIVRSVAYNETAKDISKWQPIVKKNREVIKF